MPTREELLDYHNRIMADEPTAFAELCELALPHLNRFLEAAFPQHDEHLRQSVAIDLLLAYQRRPQQYDSKQLSLFAYFRMAARHDMHNALDKKRRSETRLIKLSLFDETQLAAKGEDIPGKAVLEDWLHERTDLNFEEVIKMVRETVGEEDWPILLLMLDGNRETSVYAKIMRIEHKSLDVQRKTVKRTKDRIMKKLKRLGTRIRR